MAPTASSTATPSRSGFIVGTWVFVYIMTRIILFVVNATVGLRVAPEEEFTGLDLGEHNERGYSL